MNTIIRLSNEELRSIKSLIEYYKKAEGDHMSANEILAADNLLNKVTNAIRILKDPNFYINNVKLTTGKLYHIFSNPGDGRLHEWYVKFEYLAGKYIYCDSCISFSPTIKDRKVVGYISAGQKPWGNRDNIIEIEEVVDEKIINIYNKFIKDGIIKFNKSTFSNPVEIEWDNVLTGDYEIK